MKTIELSYNDIKKFKNLKVKDMVIVDKFLNFTTILLTNGDIVKYRGKGQYISQLDGHSMYEEVVIWDSEEEMKDKSLGLIKVM